jgi:hypothetical protein
MSHCFENVIFITTKTKNYFQMLPVVFRQGNTSLLMDKDCSTSPRSWMLGNKCFLSVSIFFMSALSLTTGPEELTRLNRPTVPTRPKGPTKTRGGKGPTVSWSPQCPCHDYHVMPVESCLSCLSLSEFHFCSCIHLPIGIGICPFTLRDLFFTFRQLEFICVRFPGLIHPCLPMGVWQGLAMDSLKYR